MNNLVLLMGPPGSGKSSHAAAMEAQGYLRISQDDQGKGHLDLFHGHVTTGRDIVIDRMNFDKQQRNRYRLEAIKNGYTVSIVEFVVPRQVCYDRCLQRQGHPTINGNIYMGDSSVFGDETQKAKSANSALNTYFSRYEEVTEDEGELLRIQYEAKEKKDAIMVDLDGTLANLDHRLPYVKDGRKDWGKFFRECDKDLVYTDVLSVVENMFQAETQVVLCSGRPDDACREKTESWLARHNIPYTSLKMRPAGNYKSDDITKAMLYRYEIKPFYNVNFVLDDRDQVVRKWRQLGLNCFQVRPGDF